MKLVRFALAVCAGSLAGRLAAAGDAFEQIERALSWSSPDRPLRARVSGALDLEGYAFPTPAPGVIQSESHALFTPRLALFFDAQLGPHVYVFGHARADRGFDPAERDLEMRMDEYAVRFTPWSDGRFSFQAGKFATIVGSWVARHGSWSNPFITAPLPYEHLTGVWDSESVRSIPTLLQWSHVRPGLAPAVAAREKQLRVPIIWGPSYALGAAISGGVRRWQYALEVKSASLSSRPDAWEDFEAHGERPTVSGRLGYRPSAAWNLGFSASRGTYLRREAAAILPAGRPFGDHQQTVLAHDIGFAHRHLQLWAEIFHARFDVPALVELTTVGYYLEARYKFTPQFSAALRWNEQRFDHIPERGVPVRWGRDMWRIDVAPAYRFSPHTQVKLQYSLEHGDDVARDLRHFAAAQYTVRF